jgi:hypothetical protein
VIDSPHPALFDPEECRWKAEAREFGASAGAVEMRKVYKFRSHAAAAAVAQEYLKTAPPRVTSIVRIPDSDAFIRITKNVQSGTYYVERVSDVSIDVTETELYNTISYFSSYKDGPR